MVSAQGCSPAPIIRGCQLEPPWHRLTTHSHHTSYYIYYTHSTPHITLTPQLIPHPHHTSHLTPYPHNVHTTPHTTLPTSYHTHTTHSTPHATLTPCFTPPLTTPCIPLTGPYPYDLVTYQKSCFLIAPSWTSGFQHMNFSGKTAVGNIWCMHWVWYECGIKCGVSVV